MLQYNRAKELEGSDFTATKYPIILVHGVAMKELRRLRAFGRIGDELKRAGYDVYVADTDGFGTVETNAAQLKRFVMSVMEQSRAEKVNIIGHSKGGLDAKYMITELDMENRVASLTTLCTPHRGSIVASRIWSLPSVIKRFISFNINSFYKLIMKDEHPDAMRVCEQLRYIDEGEETLRFCQSVYCQSYSACLERGRDCFIMALPMKINKRYEKLDSDGLVSVESTMFENYRGNCFDMSISHTQIIDMFSKKEQREKIYSFYKTVCSELAEKGF